MDSLDFNVYGETIGRNRLIGSVLTLASFKRNAKKIILDHPSLCMWIYYKNFEDMLSKFTTFSFTEENTHMYDVVLCWTIFSTRYVNNNWKSFTQDDYTTLEISINNESMQKYPVKDPWNCARIAKSKLLQNQSHSKKYFDLVKALRQARYDDLMQSRSSSDWEKIYRYRYRMLMLGQDVFDALSLLQTTEENEYYLLYIQDNAVTDVGKAPLEFFPRGRSKPDCKYSTFNYWYTSGSIY